MPVLLWTWQKEISPTNEAGLFILNQISLLEAGLVYGNSVLISVYGSK